MRTARRRIAALVTAALIATAVAAALPAAAATPGDSGDTKMGVGLDQASPATRPESTNPFARSLATAALPTWPAGVKGFDVSGWQPTVDWNRIVADGAKFVYIKATESTTYTSSYFASQWSGATRAGLIRGAYHYGNPSTSSGATQAAYFYQHGGTWAPDGLTLPPALDIERPASGDPCFNDTAPQLISWIQDFSNTMLALTGRAPTIYTNASWWDACVGPTTAFANNPLWFAQWPGSTAASSTPQGVPIGWSTPTVWQWDNDDPPGLFPGDQDVFPGSLAALKQFAAGRVQGADRYQTSAVASQSFPSGVDAVYIASGAAYPDALSAAALAGATASPVLLVPPMGTLPSATAAALNRLRASRVYVLGGQSAVSSAMVAQVQKQVSGPLARIAGVDRFDTSAQVAARFLSGPAASSGVTTVYLASGTNFPDALSGAAWAASTGAPLLLTGSGTIPAPVAAELKVLAPKRIVVLGGTSAIGDAVVQRARALTGAAVSRVSGADRYTTSAHVSDHFPATGGTVYIASGLNFPDGLSGAPLAALSGSPVLLVPGTSLPGITAAALNTLKPSNIVILGGTSAVSPGVQAQLQSYLR